MGYQVIIYTTNIHKPHRWMPKIPSKHRKPDEIFENWITTGSYSEMERFGHPETCIRLPRFPFVKWCNHLGSLDRWGCAWIVESKMARVQGSTSMESSARRGAVFFGVDGRRFFRATGFVFWWFRKTFWSFHEFSSFHPNFLEFALFFEGFEVEHFYEHSTYI